MCSYIRGRGTSGLNTEVPPNTGHLVTMVMEVMIVAPCSYWGVIDDALRGAAYRGVAVRVMGSYWNHTSRDMLHFMKSLADDTNTGYGGAIETVS